MATTEDIARLILEADTKGFAEAQAKITSTKTALDAVTTAYKAGTISLEEYVRQGAKLQAELDDITAGYKAAGEAAKKYGSNAAAAAALAERATATATNKMAGLGQAGLQAGRVIQDFAQGGVGGIINNIEGLTQAIGGGAGLAGVLTILGTAFFVLKPVIAEFMKSLSPEPVKGFQSTIETLEAKIKELTAKPVKFAIDVQQIENAKEQIDAITKGLAAYEAATSGRTVDEKAAGDKFAKEFGETGKEGAEALEAVRQQVGDSAVANDPKVRAAQRALADRERSQAAAQRAQKEAEDRATQAMTSGADIDTVAQLSSEADARKKEAEGFGDPEAMRRLRDNIKLESDEARKRARAEVGNTMVDVQKGNNPIARDVMAERFRAAGQDRFAGMVEGATPEAVKAAREKEAAEKTAAEAKEQAAREKEQSAKEAEREKEAAGRAAEHDPAAKAEQERINKIFGGFGQEGVDANQAAKNAAAARQKDNAKEQRVGEAPSANAMAQAMNDIANVAAGVVQNQAQLNNKMLQAAASLRRVNEQAAQVRREIRQPANWNGNPMGGD